MENTLTCYGEFGVGDVRTTHHTEVSLIFDLAVPNLQIVAVAHTADLVFITVLQLLRSLVPGQRDLWVVDLDLALKRCCLVLCGCLVRYVFHHRHRLRTKTSIMIISIYYWFFLYMGPWSCSGVKQLCYCKQLFVLK